MPSPLVEYMQARLADGEPITERRVGPRTFISHYVPWQVGHGNSRMWRREIYGTLYQFTAVLMPDGERRYFVSKFNGYVGGPRFACAWDTYKAIIIKSEA